MVMTMEPLPDTPVYWTVTWIGSAPAGALAAVKACELVTLVEERLPAAIDDGGPAVEAPKKKVVLL